MGDSPPASRVGGVVLRVGGALRFLNASVAVRIAAVPRITPVPGGPAELLGVAMHEGTIVAVVCVGSARSEMILCQHAGELLGVVGGQVVCAGSFDAAADSPEAVEHSGERVPVLELAALYDRIMASARAGRWGG